MVVWSVRRILANVRVFVRRFVVPVVLIGEYSVQGILQTLSLPSPLKGGGNAVRHSLL